MKKILSVFFAIVLCLMFVAPVASQTKQVDLTFEWGQTISPDFYGWILYYAPTAGGPYTQLGSDIVYGGTPMTTYTSDEVLTAPDNAETTFYFVVSALDDSGNESGVSNEVSYRADFLPPTTPVQLNVTITTIP